MWKFQEWFLDEVNNEKLFFALSQKPKKVEFKLTDGDSVFRDDYACSNS